MVSKILQGRDIGCHDSRQCKTNHYCPAIEAGSEQVEGDALEYLLHGQTDFAQVLLDFAEEYFDAPVLPVDVGDGAGGSLAAVQSVCKRPKARNQE